MELKPEFNKEASVITGQSFSLSVLTLALLFRFHAKGRHVFWGCGFKGNTEDSSVFLGPCHYSKVKSSRFLKFCCISTVFLMAINHMFSPFIYTISMHTKKQTFNVSFNTPIVILGGFLHGVVVCFQLSIAWLSVD